MIKCKPLSLPNNFYSYQTSLNLLSYFDLIESLCTLRIDI